MPHFTLNLKRTYLGFNGGGNKLKLPPAEANKDPTIGGRKELYQIQPTMKGRFLDLMEGRGGGVVDGGVAAIPAGSRRTLYTLMKQFISSFWKSSSFVIIVTRGYWGNRNGKVHNFPTKVIVRCRSVTARLVPTLHGTKAVAARVPKKVLLFAGLVDIAYVYHGDGYFTCYRRCEFGSIAEAAKGIAAWFPGTLRER
ncbi:small subunit ribosomal protein S2e [Tanacetum coccineum]